MQAILNISLAEAIVRRELAAAREAAEREARDDFAESELAALTDAIMDERLVAAGVE